MSCSSSCESGWIVDFRASFYATPHRSFLSSYKAGDFGTVRMGNSGASKIVGMSNIILETSIGCSLILKDVRHVEDFCYNLISTGRLDDEGYMNTLGNGSWKLSKGSLVVARGKKCCSLYKTQAKLCGGEVHTIEGETSIDLWHKRLGHMSEKGIDVLVKKNVFPKLKGTHLNKCVHCMLGKQIKFSFQKPPSRRKANVLELVHTDVCGPMKKKTHGGASYFVTFIDDSSRKVWVYGLKTKDEVLGVFKNFHAMVERETGKKLKCVRSDNGGEYIGPFEEYCKQYGIRHEQTVPKTPQQNGVAERMNRTIVERMRCMLSHAKLSRSYWGEALRTAVHVINRSPSKPLNGEVPEKMWSGKEATYDHLRVFGCRAFVHIPKDERTKLDDKARQCIFVGYADEKWGYKLIDPITMKVHRSRDVVFFEDQTIQDFVKGQELEAYVDDLVDIDDPVGPMDNNASMGEQIEIDDDSDEEGNNLGGNQGEDQVVHEDLGHDDEAQVEQVLEPQAQVEQVQPQAPQAQQEVRRSTRVPKPTTRYSANEYVLLSDGGEPLCYEEALEDPHKEDWVVAMKDEMKSLYKNNTFKLVERPKGRKVLKNKWVYKIKQEDGNPKPRYKARLVVKGFGQKQGVDYDEIFSPVVKMTSIRVILGLAATMDLEIEQLDVKTAFLHGELEEDVYMEQPEGFEVKGKESKVCKLVKSLYGLKQAPRQWYRKFESFMTMHGYKKTSSDHCVFVQKFGPDDFVVLLLYVDDMLIVGQNKGRISKLKEDLAKSFEMKIWAKQGKSLVCKSPATGSKANCGSLKSNMWRKFLRGSTWKMQSR